MKRANDNLPEDIKESLDYLVTGGLGEVYMAAEWSRVGGFEKVQSDTSMTIAMCILAQEAIEARNKAKTNVASN